MCGDSEKLAIEVRGLAQEITGSKVHKVSSDRRLDYAISPLDRHKETDHIFSADRDNNTRVFAFAGTTMIVTRVFCIVVWLSLANRIKTVVLLLQKKFTGFDVWYDEITLKVGDIVKNKIDQG